MLSLSEKIRLLVEWAPGLSLLSAISVAQTPADRADAALKLMQFVATKTATPIDDEVVARLRAVLGTKEGYELFEYVVRLATVLTIKEIQAS